MGPRKTLREIIQGEAAGTWLAISADQKIVAGSGSTDDEARYMAQAKGIREIVLLRVPLTPPTAEERSGDEKVLLVQGTKSPK
ncbi:MAG TPA: hypothetical protein VH079_04415 [Terriglobales bacterium]|jgi:hypothetical protein|nr:hypothetical protein [Terriglobales bacterium]